MASAVLANRSESTWPQQPDSGVSFMGKVPFSTAKPNRNPNPNPRFNKKRQFAHHVVPDDAAGHVFDELPAVTQSAASDDASSINPKLNDFSSGSYLSFSISSYSRKELIDLKNRLAVELEQIRELKNRIESSDFRARSSSNGNPLPKKMSGNKRPLPPNFGKESKAMNSQESGKGGENWVKACGQILNKLMKHKHGYIFNSPVDVVGLGLHDYYNIIKCPMDLGTVKSRMTKKFYRSPMDFAADVRLTFTNAMSYNPRGHEVNVLAEQLLVRFDELFRPLSDKMQEPEEAQPKHFYEQELQASSWDQTEADRVRNGRGRVRNSGIEREDTVDAVTRSDEVEGVSGSEMNHTEEPQQAAQAPAQTQQWAGSPAAGQPQAKRPKQPKPKAKDPNKRDMSLDEKHKLGLGLQSLPQEKMENVLHIIRKRNGHLTQEGDEIELDIEAVDTETLWELDRFVTNYKKMVSKLRRQALMGNNLVANDSKEVRPFEPGDSLCSTSRHLLTCECA